jgi:hypothetical protein
MPSLALRLGLPTCGWRTKHPLSETISILYGVSGPMQPGLEPGRVMGSPPTLDGCQTSLSVYPLLRTPLWRTCPYDKALRE